jgi:hypothetical protein
MPVDSPGTMLRVWSWNPGAGATCREVPEELVDEVRDELRGMGCVTWVTRGPLVRAEDLPQP